MKKNVLNLVYLITLASIVLGVSSCNDENEEQIFLSVSEAGLVFDVVEQVQSVDINTNAGSWLATKNQDWITIHEEGNSLKVSVLKSSEVRVGKVVVTADGATPVEIIVVQRVLSGNFLDNLTVSVPYVFFNALESQAKEIAIETNVEDWQAVPYQKWISVTKEQNALTVTVDNYTGLESSREGTILILAGGAEPIKIDVIQHALGKDDIYLKLDKEVLEFPPFKFESHLVTVITNAPEWQMESSANWLVARKVENGFVVTPQLNGTSSIRNAEIIIKTEYGEEILSVKQEAGEDPTTLLYTDLIGAYTASGTSYHSIVLDKNSWSGNIIEQSSFGRRVSLMNFGGSAYPLHIGVTTAGVPELKMRQVGTIKETGQLILQQVLCLTEDGKLDFVVIAGNYVGRWFESVKVLDFTDIENTGNARAFVALVITDSEGERIEGWASDGYLDLIIELEPKTSESTIKISGSTIKLAAEQIKSLPALPKGVMENIINEDK